jgi:protein-disulfide isomerase
VNDKQTKRQRLDQAREEARLAREKREKRQRLLKWLVPSGVSLAIVLIAALIVTLVVVNQPKPTFPNGPKNMASDGIVFTGVDGTATATETAGIEKGSKPVATDYDNSDGVAHIVTYIDWTCPACKNFESQYADPIKQLVDAGTATLEVHPIAILDRNFTGDRYSSRSANAAACVANFEPDAFLDVQVAAYEAQAEEGGPGLSNAKILDFVQKAGADSDDVADCITSEQFKPWVTAATQRATSIEEYLTPSGSFATPTIVVNGQKWNPDQTTGEPTFPDFLESAVSGA